ncbi:MAG TPA: hypothetical protein VKF40_29525 [Burkholderiales bacterium]|nr:hypothetical protein [Burkholderiales bacterium]
MKNLSVVGIVAVFLLVVTGLTGLAYHTFREDGWLSLLFDYPVLLLALVVLIVAGCLMPLKESKTPLRSRIVPNLIFYLMVAAGVYFTGHLVMTGTL